MVLDKSIETLEDLVRFLNRKQSFYFNLYDRYSYGDLSDYDHLDDSRKDDVDCDGVCNDIIETIKDISEEAQYRGLAKKAKVLCTLDGQDEEKIILDEWLMKVVRLLDSEENWNRMLSPVEGEDVNKAYYAILFRLTWVANFLDEISTKTEAEYYGGRRTDVMPYYIGESKLKEAQSISLGSALSIFEDIAEEYGLQAGIDFGEDMKSKSIFFKNLPLEDGEEDELEDKLKAALPGLNVRHWQSGTSYFRNSDGKHINEISFEVSSSGLKETSTILLMHHHKTELPNSSAPVRDGCSKCGDRSPDKVLQPLKYWCDDFNIEDISGPEDNERICVDCFKKICKDRGIRLGKKHWWMKEDLERDFKRVNEMFNNNFTTPQILKRCKDTGFIEEIKGRSFDTCTELAELMQATFADLAEELPLSCFLNAASALFNKGVVHFYESLGHDSGLKEGLGNCLGKGFGQGLFNKDSLLSKLSSKPVDSKPVDSVPEEEVEDRYVLIEVDGGDEYFIENIEPVRRLEPGEEILFTGPSVKYIKHRLAEMNRWDILDVLELRIRPSE